jgi:N-formylglutamate deformylase
MSSFALHRGSTQLLVSLPHTGTELPDDQRQRYLARALELEDTDWHLTQLYDFARELGASLLVPRYHRYLIDLNRPADGQPLYPSANNTELCPTRFFTGEPLYHVGHAPDAEEIARRTAVYYKPYHDALRAELDRLRTAHGYALLFDGHSIKSELPWLFDGKLADLNLGTASGASCAPGLRELLGMVLAKQTRYTHVVDGRFRGGHITRYYGRPQEGVHAVQLEMCWSSYMREQPPFVYLPERAAEVQALLRELLSAMLRWRPGD